MRTLMKWMRRESKAGPPVEAQTPRDPLNVVCVREQILLEIILGHIVRLDSGNAVVLHV